MSDKGPPRRPFVGSGERTVIRPDPGGRRPNSAPPPPSEPRPAYTPVRPPGYVEQPQPVPPQAAPYQPPTMPAGENPDEWITAQGTGVPQQPSVAPAPDLQIEDIVTANENPILRSAGPLLLMLGRLRVALARASFAALMEQVAEAINFFEKDIRSAGISETQANSAKYLICATADDIVQNIPTDDRHVWTQYSMLSRFFGERVGGVRFFDELTRLKLDPLLNYNVLELQHTCMALGFQGVYRTSAGGVATLQQIQRDLYETLRKVRPKAFRELSPHWRGQDMPSRHSRIRVPWWTVAGCAGILLFGLYFLYLYLLNGGVGAATARMDSLHDLGRIAIERKVVVPPLPPPPPEPDRITQLQRIRAALAPEIAAGQASADQTANRIIIRVGNVILFDSGSASVLAQFKPVAARIAATLEKEPGFIQVIGHTDNTPIGSTNVRFSSNYQLSVERAKNIASLFKLGLSKPERLQTDGKGETTPIADNKTPEGRARNRRVEILIPREETLTAEERSQTSSGK
jgi:type VI secretion system protein ImpK